MIQIHKAHKNTLRECHETVKCNKSIIIKLCLNSSLQTVNVKMCFKFTNEIIKDLLLLKSLFHNVKLTDDVSFASILFNICLLSFQSALKEISGDTLI